MRIQRRRRAARHLGGMVRETLMGVQRTVTLTPWQLRWGQDRGLRRAARARSGRRPRGGDRRLHRRRAALAGHRGAGARLEPIAQAILDARWRGVSVTHCWSRTTCAPAKLPRRSPVPAEARTSAEQALRPRAVGRRDRTSLAANRRDPGGAAALATSTSRPTSTRRSSTRSSSCATTDRATHAVRATSALLSGSANFTDTDTHANLNHVFVFHDARSAAVRDRVRADRAAAASAAAMHGDVPKAYDLGGVPVKVLFAPDHTPELEIMKQMLKADEGGLLRDLHLRRLLGNRRHDARAGARRAAQSAACSTPARAPGWAAPETLDRRRHRALPPEAAGSRGPSASSTTS